MIDLRSLLVGFPLFCLVATKSILEVPIPGIISHPVCYSHIGCFPNDGVWASLLRPLFPSPESPEAVGTRIFYFNRQILGEGKTVYHKQQFHMDNTGFDGSRSRTFFITHGFLASGNQSWLPEMKNAMLLKFDANVFLVDWAKGADQISYAQASSNTRIVGAEIARFIEHLIKNYNLDPASVHLIGHSLGSHIASYAAKKIPGIGRVTGLDAAQPGFEGLPKEVRIDKSDAKFVDLIHTNGKPTIPHLGFGMLTPLGHVDIYVNGGLEQPGCLLPDKGRFLSLEDLVTLPFKVFARWISCSHQKSIDYFTASMSSECNIWALRVNKLEFALVLKEHFLGRVMPVMGSVIRQCTKNTCTVLGVDTPKYAARGAFSATTLRQYPYCDDLFDTKYGEELKKQIMKNVETNVSTESSESK